ncbi:MAG: hypothetical protein ACTSUE_07615 [Promethearchaeota archaeon]
MSTPPSSLPTFPGFYDEIISISDNDDGPSDLKNIKEEEEDEDVKSYVSFLDAIQNKMNMVDLADDIVENFIRKDADEDYVPEKEGLLNYLYRLKKDGRIQINPRKKKNEAVKTYANVFSDSIPGAIEDALFFLIQKYENENENENELVKRVEENDKPKEVGFAIFTKLTTLVYPVNQNLYEKENLTQKNVKPFWWMNNSAFWKFGPNYRYTWKIQNKKGEVVVKNAKNIQGYFAYRDYVAKTQKAREKVERANLAKQKAKEREEAKEEKKLQSIQRKKDAAESKQRKKQREWNEMILKTMNKFNEILKRMEGEGEDVDYKLILEDLDYLKDYVSTAKSEYVTNINKIKTMDEYVGASDEYDAHIEDYEKVRAIFLEHISITPKDPDGYLWFDEILTAVRNKMKEVRRSGSKSRTAKATVVVHEGIHTYHTNTIPVEYDGEMQDNLDSIYGNLGYTYSKNREIRNVQRSLMVVAGPNPVKLRLTAWAYVDVASGLDFDHRDMDEDLVPATDIRKNLYASSEWRLGNVELQSAQMIYRHKLNEYSNVVRKIPVSSQEDGLSDFIVDDEFSQEEEDDDTPSSSGEEDDEEGVSLGDGSTDAKISGLPVQASSSKLPIFSVDKFNPNPFGDSYVDNPLFSKPLEIELQPSEHLLLMVGPKPDPFSTQFKSKLSVSDVQKFSLRNGLVDSLLRSDASMKKVLDRIEELEEERQVILAEIDPIAKQIAPLKAAHDMKIHIARQKDEPEPEPHEDLVKLEKKLDPLLQESTRLDNLMAPHERQRESLIHERVALLNFYRYLCIPPETFSYASTSSKSKSPNTFVEELPYAFWVGSEPVAVYPVPFSMSLQLESIPTDKEVPSSNPFTVWEYTSPINAKTLLKRLETIPELDEKKLMDSSLCVPTPASTI